MLGLEADRRVFSEVMRATLSKHILCIPIALNSLAYYRSLSDFVERHTAHWTAVST